MFQVKKNYLSYISLIKYYKKRIRDIKSLFLLLFLLIFNLHGSGQVTKIMGHVKDADTQEPIPFTNVIFKGTNIGVTSDFDGNFSLETKTPSDTLIASFVGYEIQSIRIIKNRFQEVTFELQSVNIDHYNRDVDRESRNLFF